MPNSKTHNRIKARMLETETDLERYYNLVKEHAKERRIYLDKVLEEVFQEYCEKHELGGVNEQLKNNRGVPKVS